MESVNKTIVVIGATGQQGRGVVNALKEKTQFTVRAITRNPDKYQGLADEVVSANLNDIDSLTEAFTGAYGVFAVTNFWEAGTDEKTQAQNAIAAAKAVNIKHFVWSTLPDVKEISNDNYQVPHFTDKAAIDELVTQAGFQHHSFVVAAFFFQNLLTNMTPQPMGENQKGWTLPIARDSQSIHMADISELGETVAGAFLHPDRAGDGQYLPVVGEKLSFDNILSTLQKLGYDYNYQEVSAEVFSGFYPGAEELAEMFGYFQAHTYMGGKFDQQDFELEHEIAGRVPSSFEQWAAKHWQ